MSKAGTLYIVSAPRSEERRVGKECSARWSPYHSRKKEEKTVEMEGNTASIVVDLPLR